MVTTNDDRLARTVDMLRNHGASLSEEKRHKDKRPYILPEFNLLGYNYRMTDLQGAVGLEQLKKLDRFIEERKRWAEHYCRSLADLDWLHLPLPPRDGNHAWQSFVIYVDPQKAPLSRNDLMGQLQQRGIATRPGTHAVHMLNYYRERFGLRPEDYPGARDCDRNSMALPLHNRMSEKDYHYVVRTIRGIL